MSTGLFANLPHRTYELEMTIDSYSDVEGWAVWCVKAGGEERFVELSLDVDAWVVVEAAARAFDTEEE